MLDRPGIAATPGAAFHSSRLIWAIGATLIVMTLAGCGIAIWNLHEQTIEQNRLAVRNIGFVLAEQTSRYMQVVDLVLQEIQSRIAALDVRSPDEFTQSLGTASVRNSLRERLKNLPQANAFSLIKADGHLLVSSREQVDGDLDFSDRDYYRHFIERAGCRSIHQRPDQQPHRRHADHLSGAPDRWTEP